MSSPSIINGWGLIKIDRAGKAECVTVKPSVCELPAFHATKTFPTWLVKGCPCGVHGCCGGKMPCLEAEKNVH
jgi:hypothetical protein